MPRTYRYAQPATPPSPTMVPCLVLPTAVLTCAPRTVALYAWLRWYTEVHGRLVGHPQLCWPALGTLVQPLRCTTRTIRTCMNELAAADLLAVRLFAAPQMFQDWSREGLDVYAACGVDPVKNNWGPNIYALKDGRPETTPKFLTSGVDEREPDV